MRLCFNHVHAIFLRRRLGPAPFIDLHGDGRPWPSSQEREGIMGGHRGIQADDVRERGGCGQACCLMVEQIHATIRLTAIHTVPLRRQLRVSDRPIDINWVEPKENQLAHFGFHTGHKNCVLHAKSHLHIGYGHVHVYVLPELFNTKNIISFTQEHILLHAYLNYPYFKSVKYYFH